MARYAALYFRREVSRLRPDRLPRNCSKSSANRTLGERIRKKRLVMGLKQVELATLLGVHEMTNVNWETGKTTPSGHRLDLVNSFLRGQLPQGRPADSKQCKAG